MGTTTGTSASNEETKMLKNIKAFAVIGVAALLAACGAGQPEPVAEPEPMVMDEPSMDKM